MALYLEPLLGYLGNIVEAYVVSELSYTPWPPTQLPLSLCLPYRGKSWVPIDPTVLRGTLDPAPRVDLFGVLGLQGDQVQVGPG